VIVAAVLLSASSGSLLLIWPSPAALTVASVVALAILIASVSLRLPWLALYALILIIYFPIGGGGAGVRVWYSLLFDGTLALALLGFSLNSVIQRRSIALCSAIVLMTLFLIWCVITLLWATHLIEARQQLVTYALDVLLLLLVYNLIDSREKLDQLMHCIALGAWMLALVGLGLVLTTTHAPGDRLQIFDLNENLAPLLLTFGLAGVVWVAVYPIWLNRWIAVVQSLVFLSLVILLCALSGSRGGILSLLVMLILMLLSRSTRALGGFGLAIAAVGILTEPMLFITITERFANPESVGFGDRMVHWASGALLLYDHPWGVGIGNGQLMIPNYLYSLTSIQGLGETRSTHNPLLDVAIDTGLPGLILYTGAIIAALASFANAYLRSPQANLPLPQTFYKLMFCTTAAYLISWIRDGGMNHHPLFFILLGLLLLPARLLGIKEKQCPPSSTMLMSTHC
jgi:putative inorganic carbon (hco3(-)) transporter